MKNEHRLILFITLFAFVFIYTNNAVAGRGEETPASQDFEAGILTLEQANKEIEDFLDENPRLTYGSNFEESVVKAIAKTSPNEQTKSIFSALKYKTAMWDIKKNGEKPPVVKIIFTDVRTGMSFNDIRKSNLIPVLKNIIGGVSSATFSDTGSATSGNFKVGSLSLIIDIDKAFKSNFFDSVAK